MNKNNVLYIALMILISFLLSSQNKYLPTELLIDPANPDIFYVQRFQEKYMGMNNTDIGYGSFGPKTTQKWKEIIATPTTYVDLFDLASRLKDESSYQDSNTILHYLVESHYSPSDIIIKSKFLIAQIYYDLSFFEEAISYFKVLIDDDLDSEYRKKSLFMIAYIYNNNLDMYTDALNYYSQFLSDYSKDDLVASVNYEIEQINNILENIKE